MTNPARTCAVALVMLMMVGKVSAQPFASLEYRIVGTQLRVSPIALSVPKGVPGSVLVEVAGASSGLSDELIKGAYIEALLRGPSFDARRVVGRPNAALLLPPLNLVGDYQLDHIRLVDEITGVTRMDATPGSIPIRVFDEVLVSRVTSRPLTMDEIKEKGIVIDEQNFRAVEFEVGFVLDGRTIPVKFPVVAPAFKESTEIIPQAEVEARLAKAAEINREISATAQLPEELETANLKIEVQTIQFQRVEGGEIDLRLKIPPIPALMVIPGNIGFLNQFFSVQIFTENAAPSDSGLSVMNVKAELILPPGADRIPGTSFENPGDDPLRFARLGPDKVIQNTQPVVRPGADGKPGSADDILRLYPGESGQGEFLVEGLQEGLHVMDLKLTADLEGLAAGVVTIQGKAAGSVLVRNPKFSMAFSHPRTTRAGEPYDAFVTILNTSPTAANLVSVTLSENSLSGGALESEPTVELGTINPGQTATAKFRVRAQRTGAITFSNLTTSDDSVQGRFRLRMGVDERGVALSPDSIGMPDYVTALPEELIATANRVLGQALSIATAPQLPPNVKPVKRSVITQRVLELAEAGQRLRYGDGLNRVLADLLLDWQGGRNFSAGFDQILRETDAGSEFRESFMRYIEAADALDSAGRLAERASDLAGRGERWVLAASSVTEPGLTLVSGSQTAMILRSDVPGAAAYGGARGQLLGMLASTNAFRIDWRFTNAIPTAELGALCVNANGTARLLRWPLADIPAGASFSFASGGESLAFDLNSDGTADGSIQAVASDILESAPSVVAVLQDTTVDAGRPTPTCLQAGGLRNYGTVLAVLFSKPMTQAGANVPEAYRLDDGNSANSVQIQPSGRVALLNMRRPVAAIRARNMTVTGVSDARGNLLAGEPRPVQTTLLSGVSLRGRVVRADGSPAAGVPVTLTMYDEQLDPMFADCQPFTVRVCQVNTDAQGLFQLDFVPAGIPYSVSATDTAGLSEEAIDVILDSASESQVARDKLLDLANSPSVKNTLLGAFAVGALPEAIAKAEGLDRAVLRDLVLVESARCGTEVPVALRFRGRGSVVGMVVGADGITPVPGAAVNLFPDPGSRELGRGVFADDDGRFAFMGVPLGVFTLEARTSSQQRTMSGVLDRAGASASVIVDLSSTVVPRTGMAGRVVEADNVTPHPRATVMIGRFNESRDFVGVVAIKTTDAAGYWSADDIPAASYDVVGVSLDGKRKGDREGITAAAGNIANVSIALQSTARVIGRVERSGGQPVANAIVAGGEALVRTDANGLFTLTGVPTGRRSISAGVERNPEAGFDFPRRGGASLNVIAGIDNFVVIRLAAKGRIVGRVLDSNGVPVPNVRVALPYSDGFFWVDADRQGNYKFEDFDLGQWTVSAPSGPAVSTDVSGILETLRTSSSEDEMMAAINEAFSIFSGANDPYLTGEGTSFNPGSWGFTTATVRFDGETAVADIRYLRAGTISGKVVNAQGVPIGARVRLTGIGPLASGFPATVLRGERDSDPSIGTFEFPGQAFVGSWGLQVASPFYPTVVTMSGYTTSVDPDATNVVLQFPPVREVNGRIAGTVFRPDGQPADAGVSVKIDFGDDYVIRTSTNGFFDTQIQLPAFVEQPGGFIKRPRTYRVDADDVANGWRGIAHITIRPGITNIVNVQLLDRGDLEVTVRLANGEPASGATVDVVQGSYPGERFMGSIAPDGFVRYQNIFEGSYSVAARLVTGPTTIQGRAGASVKRGETTKVTVTLSPTATIRGEFTKRDGTPVGYAQVAIGSLGFATTDQDGRFEVSGIPLGTYRLTSEDPVSGIGARLYVTLTYDGEVQNVRLIEHARGEIAGTVINSYGTGTVPGAQVTLSVQDGLALPRTVTTGSDGAFSFPGTPAGAFNLRAVEPRTEISGQRTGTLAENVPSMQVHVQLEALASLAGAVYDTDGITMATNATVELSWPNASPFAVADTDANGRVAFADLKLGGFVVRAFDRATGRTRSVGTTNVSLTKAGVAPEFAIVLSGVGAVNGTVFLSDGVTPAAGAEVDLRVADGDHEVELADAAGRFAFDNVAIGPYRVSAMAVTLGASSNGIIEASGEADAVDLVLGASGTAIGRLVLADGTTPALGIDVLLTFASQSGLPGRAVDRVDSEGMFRFENIPVGNVTLEAIAASINGIVRLSRQLTANGEVLDLGNVALDQDDPRVVLMTPAPTAAGVPIETVVDLFFNEALSAASVNSGGVYLRFSTNMVPATVSLLADPTNDVSRLVRLTPNAPLQSEVTYQIVVVDGERRDPFGSVIATGPRDLVGRQMTAPFMASFTTADQLPPVLVSIYPSNNAVQIDPRAVMRLTFSEAIREKDFTFTVTGPDGPIAGITSVALNGRALAFTPAAALAVNAVYTIAVDGVRDIAGNVAVGQPFTSRFSTLDTLGPAIASLRIGDNRSPIAGSTLPIEAVLAVNESGASVRFTADFDLIGSASAVPYRAAAMLPEDGKVTFRAVAIDRFGNEGPVAELVVTVVPNELPTITLARATPTDGLVASGAAFSLRLSASDDLGVKTMTLSSQGALTLTTSFSSGAEVTLQLTMPAGAIAGSAVQFRAYATDELGVNSTDQVLEIPVSDGTAPALTIVSPIADSEFLPGASLPLEIEVSDNSSSVEVKVQLSGALTASAEATVALDPPAAARRTLSIVLPDVPADGSAFTALATVTDAANHSASASRTFRLTDLLPPELSSIQPTNDATGIALRPNIEIRFSEALDANSANDTTLKLAPSAGGGSVAVAITFPDTQTVRIQPLAGLVPETLYRLTISTGITDRAGNALTAEIASVFETTDFALASPANGSRVIEGQTLNVEASLGNRSGVSAIRLRANGVLQTENTLPPYRTEFVVPTIATLGGTSIVFAAEAVELQAGGAEPLVLASVTSTVTVLPAAADEDGDGWTNGFELARGMDPFVAESADGDLDNDGLTNALEQTHGTDPAKADSDDDGLKDGAEIAVGANPLDPDTDDDGFLDGVDATPLIPMSAPAIDPITAVELIEGVSARLSVTARDRDLNLAGLRAASADTWQQLKWDRGTDALYAQPIGGFDSTRGGAISLASGSLTEEVRGAITNVFRSAVFTSSAALTPAYLETIRFLLIASPSDYTSAITPLTTAEQNAVREFATTGGAALLLADNDAWVAGADLANESVIDAFGLDITGALNNTAGAVTVVDPASSAVTSGPFGAITSYTTPYPGWFDGLGTLARTIATLNANGKPTLALIDRGVLSPTNGIVLLSSDAQLPSALVLNALAAAGFTNRMPAFSGELLLTSAVPGTSEVQIVAFDADSLSVTQRVSIVTLADLDADGIADRDDADIDGDGLANTDEQTAGTDPRDPDSDDDRLNDGAEVAAGTNPLDSDTDDDGAIDGLDPNPLVPSRITFTAPAEVTLNEGASTNIPVLIEFTGKPLVWVGFAPDSTPPAFAAFGAFQFANNAPDFTCGAQLSLYPLHDAAGAHALTLRAVAQDGTVANHQIAVTVQDNASLQVNSWNSGASGSWDNAANWSLASVPGSSHSIVIAAPASVQYTITVPEFVFARSFLLNHGNALVMPNGPQAQAQVAEIREGTVRVVSFGILQVPRPMVNRGTIELVGEVYARVGSGGRMENRGVLRATSRLFAPINFYIPLHVTSDGAVSIQENGWLSLNRGASIAGTLDVQSGDLDLDAGSPYEFVLLDGARIQGAGNLTLKNNSRLVFQGNSTLSGNLALRGSSTVAGLGRLDILAGGSATVDHTVAMPGSVAVSGTLALSESTAVLTIDGTLVLNPGGVLQNTGTIRVDEFINNGGTIEGNPPVVGPGVLSHSLHIDAIELVNASTRRDAMLSSPATDGAAEIVVRWAGDSSGGIELEQSSDLETWQPCIGAVITETSPRAYEARINVDSNRQLFFRLKRAQAE